MPSTTHEDSCKLLICDGREQEDNFEETEESAIFLDV